LRVSCGDCACTGDMSTNRSIRVNNAVRHI